MNSEELRATIADNVESDTPEVILEILRRNEGKAWNVHLLRKLPGGVHSWRIERTRYHAKLVGLNADKRSMGTYDFSIPTVGFLTGTPGKVNASEFEAKNTPYYAGRRERNARRLEAMNDPVLLANASRLITQAKFYRELAERLAREFHDKHFHASNLSPEFFELDRIITGEGKNEHRAK